MDGEEIDESKKCYPGVYIGKNVEKRIYWNKVPVKSNYVLVAKAISEVELDYPVTVLVGFDNNEFLIEILVIAGISVRKKICLFSTDVEDRSDPKQAVFEDIKKEFISRLNDFIKSHIDYLVKLEIDLFERQESLSRKLEIFRFLI
ncbi:hypothetical protein KKH36_01155 [Patescibacteria group bacterium]|nr:hypothetical protein [Patescibacteria group bacterium]